MDQDSDQLRLLSIFHYVVGGMMALFACLPIIHLVVGLFLALSPEKIDSSSSSPRFIGWIFVFFAAGIIAIGWSIAGIIIWAGRCLQRHRNHTFCLVTACISCVFMPFGTVLGIFTIIVLMRPSVKTLFAQSPAKS